MNLINLTPHAMTLLRPEGEPLVLPPSGRVASVRMETVPAPPMDGLPVSIVRPEAVEGLPDREPGTALIVSALVLAAVPGRADVFAPGPCPAGRSGCPACRDASGRPIAAHGLSGTPAYGAAGAAGAAEVTP